MFKTNFVNLCNKKNIAPTVVLVELGYTKSTFSHWDDDTVPRHSTLLKIADYFGVTVDELLREAPKEEGVNPTMGESPEKDKLSSLLETLSPEQLRQVADYVDFIISKRK